MASFFLYAALVSSFLVLAVLGFGVLSFARGGEFNRKYANKIMRLRIVTQAIAVIFILLAVLARQNG